MTTKTEAVTSIVNNNLQDALALLINKSIAGVDAAAGFLQEQIPDVIHQLLVWNLVKSTIIASVAALIAVAALILCVKLVKKDIAENDRYERGLISFVSIMGYIIIGVTCYAAIYKHALSAIQIWLAPKVWLIEYAASLVKGN